MIRFGLVAFCVLLLGSAHASTDREREWRFTVYLDGNPIGYHNFRVEDAAGERLVASDAEFNVKFLFFTAYRYEYENRETWSSGCLKGLESRTDDNGELFRVRARKRDKAFVIDSRDGESEIASCVKTFAYWDHSFLTADRLLNAQTGEYLDVVVSDLGTDRVAVRGEERDARRYCLTARGLTIDVWYSPEREWLALASSTDGGRLSYVIQ